MAWNAIPVYPEAEATHQQVSLRAQSTTRLFLIPPKLTSSDIHCITQVRDDRALFNTTLERLIGYLGQRVKIPKISGIEVDLHTLYRSVTDLGGVESVINKKQFVVACQPFNFPPSFTNKSFVIKKLYFNALYHYEQVYFRRLSGQPVHNTNVNTAAMMSPSSHHLPPIVANHSGSSSDRSLKRPRMEGGCESPRPLNPSKTHHHHHHHPNAVQGPPMNLNSGDRFNGIIDFAGPNGYFVTVTVMGQRFQCAMVNRSVAEGSQAAATLFPSTSLLHPLQEMDSGLRLGAGNGNGYRKTRAAPLPPKSAFEIFLDGVDRSLIMGAVQLPEGVDPSSDISQELYLTVAHQVFDGMDQDQKVTFEGLAERDRQRYDEEVRESQSTFLSVEAHGEEVDFGNTPSSMRHTQQRAHMTPSNRVMGLPLPYNQFDHSSYMPFGPPVRHMTPRDISNVSGAVGAAAPDDDDSRCLEHVLGAEVAPEDDEMDLAIELGANVDLKDHLDIFGGVAQVATMVPGSGFASKGSSLLMGGTSDKSPMADGISSACTTATREKALV